LLFVLSMHRKIAKGVVLEALVMGRNILSDMVRNTDSNAKIRDIISRFYIGEISPTRCNNCVLFAMGLRIKNAIVASCWTYFTDVKHDARNHKY
jgi:hypothetical protein